MNLDKLKIKTDTVRVLNFDFDVEVNKTDDLTTTLFFVKTIEDLEMVNKELSNYDMQQDTLIFVIFPKKTSKKYKGQANVSRDIIKDGLLVEKFNLVSLVSLDDDLSGARIRFNKFIKGL